MFEGFPLWQNVSFALVTVPGLNAGKIVICLTPLAHNPVPLAAVTKHAYVRDAVNPDGGS